MLGLGLGVAASPPSTLSRYSLGGKTPAWISDFASGIYAANGQRGAFGDMHDFERLSAAWKRNGVGDWTHVPAGDPRTGHHVWKDGKLVTAGIAMAADERENLQPNFDITTSTLQVVSGVVDTSFGALGLQNGVHFADNSVGRYAYIKHPATVGERYVFYALVMMDDGGTPVVGSSSAAYDFSLVLNSNRTSQDLQVIEVWPGIYLVSASITAVDNDQNFGIVKYTGQSARGFKVSGYHLARGSLPQGFIPTSGSAVAVAGESLSLKPAELSASLGGAMPEALTVLLRGYETHADDGVGTQASILEWGSDPANMAKISLGTWAGDTGRVTAQQSIGGTSSYVQSGPDALPPGVDQPFAIAATFSTSGVSAVVNGVDCGSASALDLASLLSEPMKFGGAGRFVFSDVRIWAGALADMPSTAALQEATS